MGKEPDSFAERVTEECGRSSRALSQMADRFREFGDLANAALCETIAHRLSRLSYDAMSQTQPIRIPLDE